MDRFSDLLEIRLFGSASPSSDRENWTNRGRARAEFGSGKKFLMVFWYGKTKTELDFP